MRARLGAGLWPMAVAALLLWACSDTSDDASPSESTAGQAGAGGACSDDGPAEEEVPTCGPLPLADYCDATNCPTAPSDFDLGDACFLKNQLNRFDTDCGGVVLRHPYGLSQIDYYFDDEDNLTGIVAMDDTDTACGCGTYSFTRTYGTVCVPLGEPERLCGEGGGGAGAGAGAGGEGGAGGSGGQGGAGGAL